MGKISRWLEGTLGVAALIAVAVLLTVLFSRAANPARTSSPALPPATAGVTPTSTVMGADQVFNSHLKTPQATPRPTPTPTVQPDILSMVQDVSISPGGSRLLLISRRTPQEKPGLFVMSLETDEIEPFPARSEEIVPKQVDWSPDGRQVAIATSFQSGPGVGSFQDIYVNNADGTSLVHLTPGLGEGINDFVWSPDSRKIACIVEPKDYADPDNLWVCYVDNPHCVRFEVRAFAVAGSAMGYIAWSPDSSKVAVGYQPGVALGELALVDVATGMVEALPQPDKYRAPHPVWFPDGKRIGFFATREEVNAEPEFWTVAVDSRELTLVAVLHASEPPAYSSGSFPQWLSEDRIIFYWNDAIWSMQADGSELGPLGPIGEGRILGKAPSISLASGKVAFVVKGCINCGRIAILDMADNSVTIK